MDVREELDGELVVAVGSGLCRMWRACQEGIAPFVLHS